MHKNAKNLIGKQFGKLIVISDTSKRESGKIIWKCLCDCGKIAFVSTSNLTKKMVKSCGCLRYIKGTNHHSWKGGLQESYRRRKESGIYRNSYYIKTYGITLEEYNKLLKKQKYRCAICGTYHKEKQYKRLYVDHNHETNEIRGLICNKCNSGIGYLADKKNYLQNAINYLNGKKNF